MSTSDNVNNDLSIKLHISNKFFNKTILDGDKRHYATGFYPVSMTPRDLFNYATTGKAFTLAYFGKDSRHGDHWKSSQVVALDLDDCSLTTSEIAQIPFVAQYAAFVYPTPSNTHDQPKNRVVFVLSEEIDQPQRWQTLQMGLMAHLQDIFGADPACKDLPRFFFGSDQPGGVFIGQTLPLTVAGSLTVYEADEERINRELEASRADAPPRPVITGDRAENIASKLLDRYQSELSGIHSERHNALMTIGAKVFSVVNAGWNSLTPQEAERALLQAMTANGYHSKVGGREIERNINYLRDANPMPAPEDSGAKKQHSVVSYIKESRNLAEKQPLLVDDYAPDIVVNVEHLRDAQLPDCDLLLKSDLGTGKTEMAKERIPENATLLVLTHRQALGAKLAEDFNAAYYLNYLSEDDEVRRALPYTDRLVISLDSIQHIVLPDNTLPHYDYVFVDEVSAQLAHFASGKFKSSPASTNHAIFEQVIKQAKRLIFADAFADGFTSNYCKSLRASLKSVLNEYVRPRAPMYFYESRSRGVDELFCIADKASDPVIIASSERAEIEKLEAKAKQRYGPDAVLAIVGGKSAEHSDFLANIDTEIRQLKVFLYSPAIGDGVSIRTPVAAVLGIYPATCQYMTAPEIHQQINRARNVDRVLIHINTPERDKETNDLDIYDQGIRAAIQSGITAGFEDGYLIAPASVRKLHSMTSQVEARRNASINHLTSHFIEIARSQGVKLHFIEGETESSERVKNEMIKLSQDMKNELKSLTINPNTAAVTSAEYDHIESPTPEQDAGHLKWKIEQCAGQDITEEIYDQLHKSQARGQVYTMADILFANDAELMERDRSEVNTRERINHRRHHYRRIHLLRSFLRITGFLTDDNSIDADTVQEAGAIMNRARSWIALHKADIASIFGRRADSTDDTLDITRHILKQCGLYLYQTNRGSEMPEYKLHPGKTSVVIKLAISCHSRQKKHDLESPEKQDSVVFYKKESRNLVEHTSSKSSYQQTERNPFGRGVQTG